MTTHGTVRKMTDRQRGDIVATIAGAIPANLTFEEAQSIIGKKGPFVAEIREVFRRRRGQPLLLESIDTVTIPATTDPFVAREKFVVGHIQVKISWIGSNFQNWFLGKTEEPLAETILRYAKLARSLVDDTVLAEFGDKAETTLAQIWALMERQKNGEEGVLLTNGWANIFYVRDLNGRLRAASVRWDEDGWSVNSYSVVDPHRWIVGFRVFSSNS